MHPGETELQPGQIQRRQIEAFSIQEASFIGPRTDPVVRAALVASAVLVTLQAAIQAFWTGRSGSVASVLDTSRRLAGSVNLAVDDATALFLDGEACGGLHGFDKVHTPHPSTSNTEFLTFWTDPTDDTDIYFEVPLASLPLEIGVGAILARGPFAHFDAADEDGDDFILFFNHSGNGTNLDLWRKSLAQRTLQVPGNEYRNLWQTGQLPIKMAHFWTAATRTRKVEGKCETSHVIVNAKSLAASAFSMRSDLGLKPRSDAHVELASVRGFQKNIDFTVVYSVAGVAIRFCVHALPTETMETRVADDRVGYFLTSFQQLGDYRNEAWRATRPEELLDPTVRLINRQRAQYQEIKFYVDHTVPEPFREATKRGIWRWQAAFDQVGIEIKAYAPGDDGFPEDYDVGDIRFNTVSWATGGGEVFAEGDSVQDPRTGEIMKANIVFTVGWLEGWLGDADFYSPPQGWREHRSHTDKRGRRGKASWDRSSCEGIAKEACGLGASRNSEAAYLDYLKFLFIRNESVWHAGDWKDWAASASATECLRSGNGPSFRRRDPLESVRCRALHDPAPHVARMLLTGQARRREIAGHSTSVGDREREDVQRLLEDGITDVTSHEVGHTLGLRHNFQGSLSVTFAQSQDKAFVEKNGLSSSVMDYIAVNIISEASRKKLYEGREDPGRAPFFTPVVGEYDKWAIKYGYTPLDGSPAEKAKRLAAIAAEYGSASFTFATDDDADFFDPYTRRHDLTNDPLRWAIEEMALAQEALQTVHERTIHGGETWVHMEAAMERLLWTAEQAVSSMVYFVGGLRASRQHTTASLILGRPDPLRAVERTVQDLALSNILRFLNVTFLKPELQRESIKRHQGFYGIEPYDLQKSETAAKTRIVSQLLDPARCGYLRLSEDLPAEEGQPHARGFHDVLRQVSAGLLGMPDNANSSTSDPARHDVQLFYVKHLAELRSLSLQDQERLDQRVAAAVTGEMIRIRGTLSKILRQNMRSSADSPEMYMQTSFLAAALRYLKLDG